MRKLILLAALLSVLGACAGAGGVTGDYDSGDENEDSGGGGGY